MPSLFPSSFFLIVLFIYLSTTPSLSDPRATEAALMCTNRTASPSERQTFIANFLAALDSITPLINTDRYASVVKGTQNATVFAFGECMKDLSQTDCNLCFAQCKTQILRCRPFQKATRGGRLFYDGCYLRYDDYNFFSEALSAVDKKVCGSTNSSGNSTVPKAIVVDLMRNLSVVALKNDGFYTGFVSSGNLSVYGLAQCWEYVNGSNCEKCLDDAISKINSCPPEEEGRVLNAGCYLRYSTQKFYNNSASPSEGGNDGNRLAVILAATSSALAFLLIVTATVMFAMKRVQKRKRERKQLGSLLAKVNKSELNISYETLEKATNYFHSSHKLGQGGSGSVYKGILPNGKAVAIKRLFFNTRQWVDHFFNEVNLISGLHHKNLVKLLGCSITGPESLLVYEYVENRSLSDHLCVDRENVQPLSWEVRYKIIVGTAEGLAYLHEESKLRIIHRDIKLSNILLDEDFTPKIADFGLARLFPEDKTHITTAIAGTLGYMAPEYVVRGKLTEKADVYSFGVLVLELICGKTNNSACQNSLPILQTVWDLYGRGRICEAVDPSLEANFNEGEASRVLQIGLLCVQASADLRPSMSTVVKMLNDNTAIPRPTQPPFLNSNSVEIRPIIQNESSSSLLGSSKSRSSGNSMTQSWVDPR